jgi:hypothetical protein
MTARCFPPALVALTALLAACSRPAVETYRVPKEAVAAAPAPATDAAAPAAAGASASGSPAGGTSMANTPVATASGPGLTWKAPAGWTEKPASAMRKGSFAVPGDGVEGDLSITAFPGNVGGDLANLNRWRGQLSLPPVTEGEFASTRQLLERNGLKMTVVEINGSGDTPQSILGAMIPLEGSTWFVKLGPTPAALVAKQKANFMAFLDTIKPATAAK